MKRLGEAFWLCLILCLLINTAYADIEVHFLDVGQADAAIIICDNETLMIDGGNVDDSQFIYSYLRNTLKLNNLDYVISSHPHEDHVGGLAAALNACKVGTVYSPVISFDSKPFMNFLKYAGEPTVPTFGDTFALGGAQVTFVSSPVNDENVNNLSLVVRIVYDKVSFLFTGDIEYEAEKAILDSGIEIESTVLKVAHHGSDTSSSKAFLQAVHPHYAVISVGKNNDYGHPSPVTLKSLQVIPASIIRTDVSGTIVMKSDGRNISYTVEKGGRRR